MKAITEFLAEFKHRRLFLIAATYAGVVFVTIIIQACLLLTSCAPLPSAGVAPQSGIALDNFDRSVRPQDDFYEYVNGNWLARTTIPADQSNYGVFHVLADKAEEQLLLIIEEVAAMEDVTPGSEEQKVRDYFRSFMDSTTIESLGLEPLRADLDDIADVQDRTELMGVLIDLEISGVQDPLAFFVDQDEKNSSQYILYVSQSGLGLPDREYYLGEDPRLVEIRTAYQVYIEDLLALAGQSEAAARAECILALETDLARLHWTAVENRDRDRTYNPRTMAALNEMTPNFDWMTFLPGVGTPPLDSLIVIQPSYLEGFDSIYVAYSVEDWKTYLTYKLLDNHASFLSSDYVNLRFDFYGRTLSGIEELEPRWKRAVGRVNASLGEAVGKIYVARYFQPDAKARMVDMVDNLKESFSDRLDQLDWMEPATKEQARIKLGKFTAKIGYPDVWRDYSALEIGPGQLVANVRAVNAFEHYRNVRKLGGPIDRNEWFMTPQTVNAYYNPNMNEVVFPAAILQPPFFNLTADEAVNYGAIGAVIGHEMTHGFDDQGRKSDGDGNLREWWTTRDAEEFMRRAQVIVEQYNAYNPLDTLHINGELTLGENIADLGGLTIAYNAYRKSLGGVEPPVIDGFTGDQRFFIGWAQVWPRLYRDDALRQRLLTDPHSPSRYRVNGVVANMPEFYTAFDVEPGDPLHRPDNIRVKIW